MILLAALEESRERGMSRERPNRAQKHNTKHLDMLNEIENQTAQMKLADIEANFEFQVALLGGPGVGKTSLLHKVINNFVEQPDDDTSAN